MAMSVPSLPKTWIDGQILTAAHLNGNFTTIRDYLNSYGPALNAANTFSVVQTFSAGLVVSASGITVTGNSSITGTLSGVTTLTCTTVTATNLGGTLTTASQPNITTLAGVTSLTATAATITTLTMGTTGKVISGSTSLSFRNNADATTWLSWTNGTNAIVLGGSTHTVTIGAGAINLSPSSGGSITVTLTGATDFVVGGAIATNAANGFMLIPSCAGAPTGAAANNAMVYDSTNHKICVRDGGTWKATAALT